MNNSKMSGRGILNRNLWHDPCFKQIRLLILALVVLSVAVPSLTASADQQFNLTERLIPIPHPITSLLRSGGIHRELNLTPEIITRIEQAADEVDQPLWRLRDLPPDKRNEQAGKLIEQLKRRLSQSLNVRQMNRLNQIVWQAQGIEAILEPEVAARLGLSTVQKTSIIALLSTGYQRIAEVNLNTQIHSETVRASYVQRIQTETQQKITVVLSPAQQNAFRALIGQPVNMSQVRIVACKAPEFEVNKWINKPKVTLSELKGKVTVIHFYAFGCGNCTRTLPYYNKWRDHFPSSAFQIIGIHRPETQQERDIDKVKKKAAEAGIEYPVAIDNESLMWNAWANCVWPSIYLLDKNGYVRYWWYGELNWQGAESEKYLRSRIQELIEEKS